MASLDAWRLRTPSAIGLGIQAVPFLAATNHGLTQSLLCPCPGPICLRRETELPFLTHVFMWLFVHMRLASEELEEMAKLGLCVD